jgi:NitT/TauT family transport system permease protein
LRKTLVRVAYRSVGIGLAVLFWQLITVVLPTSTPLISGFSPAATLAAVDGLAREGVFSAHMIPSLMRFAIGLGIGLLAGVPLGLLTGYFPKFDLTTNTVFQFLRVTSPLAWMPVAVIAFGVGGKPVIFLIAMAAVWPIAISTAHGVRTMNPKWIQVVRMLGGGHVAVMRRAVVPAVLPQILSGLRISVGVSWIVLVPAEMLGVSSGLGYYLLDTRDRFNYGELMAVILLIGLLGYACDSLIRSAQYLVSWPTIADDQQGPGGRS